MVSLALTEYTHLYFSFFSEYGGLYQTELPHRCTNERKKYVQRFIIDTKVIYTYIYTYKTKSFIL